jgi:alkylation response protein AidB-like acyl-CoA dehydrogenase
VTIADLPTPFPVASDDWETDDPLANDVEQLGRSAADAADDLDRECRLSDALSERAARLGLFRQLVPTELGGRGDVPLRWFRRGVELARHEPSIAWVVTQGAAELGWIASGGDEDWAREVLADPMSSSASTVAGIGTLRCVDGRFLLAGRWGFDTGSDHASWLGGLAMVLGLEDAGASATRMCWVPAEYARVLGDWDPIGLRGTGSHSLVIDEQEVEPAWTFDPWSTTTNDRGPYRCLVGNGNWPIAAAVAATQLGNARRCLDECRRLVVTKSPAPAFTPLAANAAVQRRLTELEGEWMGASCSVERELVAMWHEARHAGELSSECRWRLATAHAHANRIAVRVVDGAVELTGAAVVDRHSVIARALCDARALAGHIATSGYVQERAAQIGLGLLDADRLV